MKFTPLAITVLVVLLRFTFVMAQTSDCQKKCDEAFIRCSGTCATSTDTACGAGCIKDRDACKKGCSAVPVKPRPAPDIEKDKGDAGDDEDEGDIDDDDTGDDTDDMDDDSDMPDVPDIQEEDL